MKSNKSKDTIPERILGSALWSAGLRYRKNYTGLPGTPDFVFLSQKVIVFCDGDFWHGNNWRLRGYSSFEEELKKYSEFWKDKIQGNVFRDKRINQKLQQQGWTVLRFWESQIRRDENSCVNEVKRALRANNS